MMKRKFLFIHTGPLSHLMMALKAIETFCQAFPDLEIDILTHPIGTHFLDTYTSVRKVYTLPQPWISAPLWPLIKCLRTEQYLGVIVFEAPLLLRLLGRLCRIPILIGPKTFGSWIFFHHAIRPYPGMHLSEVYLKYLAPLDIHLAEPVSVKQKLLHDTPRWLQKHLSPSKKTLCLFLDDTESEWRQAYRFFLEKLIPMQTYNIVVCATHPIQDLPTHPSLLNITGKLHLTKLVQAIAYADYVVTANAAMMQAACLFEKPLVGLLPNTPFFAKQFGPYSPYSVLLPIKQTLPQDILRAFEQLMHLTQVKEPISTKKQKATLALLSYKVLYIIRTETLSLPEYRTLIDLRQQGLDILPLSLQSWKSLGILSIIKKEGITIVQGEIPWVLGFLLKKIWPLLGYKPILIRQKFHRYIRLKEYLAMYQAKEY